MNSPFSISSAVSGREENCECQEISRLQYHIRQLGYACGGETAADGIIL